MLVEERETRLFSNTHQHTLKPFSDPTLLYFVFLLLVKIDQFCCGTLWYGAIRLQRNRFGDKRRRNSMRSCGLHWCLIRVI